MNANISSGCQFGQHIVNQTPKFDNAVRKARRPNQVMSKAGFIRRAKRKKAKYL